MENKIRVRFAPSPTGHLHVGGARTALFNFLYARKTGGKFILRVEDTDLERSTKESEEMVLNDLKWLNLEWDEGPDIGGDYGPYRQSERLDLYKKFAYKLLEEGRAYRCFCTDQELEEMRKKAEQEKRPPHYDRRCLRLSEEEVKAKMDAGIPYTIRFKVPEKDYVLYDLVRGKVEWKSGVLGDFVILRSNGMPVYNFCVVVDDHLMEISHVIRAEEHLPNTLRQLMLYEALGWKPPKFAHVSLILGKDRSKLSKRHGATSVSQFKKEGYLPEAMTNYLALLGWNDGTDREEFTLKELIEKFSLKRVSKSPAVFDIDKLNWINSLHIKKLTDERYLELSREFVLEKYPFLEKAYSEKKEWVLKVINMVKKGLTVLKEIPQEISFLFEYKPWEEEDILNLFKEDQKQFEASKVIAKKLSELKEITIENLWETVNAVKKEGFKGKYLFHPLRIVVSGKNSGPEIDVLIESLIEGRGIENLIPIEERVKLFLEHFEK